MLPGLVSGIVGSTDERGIRLVGVKQEGISGFDFANRVIDISSGLTGGIGSAALNGDFVLAVYSLGSDTDETLTITDGTNNYTLVGSELYIFDNEATNLRVAYKFITTDTSVTFGQTPSTIVDGVCSVFVLRGVNATTPLDVAVTTATGANSFLPNPPAITPITQGAQIIAIGAGAVPAGAFNIYDTPSDLVNFHSRHETAGAGGRSTIQGIGMKTDWVSGSFNPSAFTNASSDRTSSSWAAMTIALRPA